MRLVQGWPLPAAAYVLAVLVTLTVLSSILTLLAFHRFDQKVAAPARPSATAPRRRQSPRRGAGMRSRYTASSASWAMLFAYLSVEPDPGPQPARDTRPVDSNRPAPGTGLEVIGPASLGGSPATERGNCRVYRLTGDRGASAGC